MWWLWNVSSFRSPDAWPFAAVMLLYRIGYVSWLPRSHVYSSCKWNSKWNAVHRIWGGGRDSRGSIWLTRRRWLYVAIVVFLNGLENDKLTSSRKMPRYKSMASRIFVFRSVTESMPYKMPHTINISPTCAPNHQIKLPISQSQCHR